MNRFKNITQKTEKYLYYVYFVMWEISTHYLTLYLYIKTFYPTRYAYILNYENSIYYIQAPSSDNCNTLCGNDLTRQEKWVFMFQSIEVFFSILSIEVSISFIFQHLVLRGIASAIYGHFNFKDYYCNLRVHRLRSFTTKHQQWRTTIKNLIR